MVMMDHDNDHDGVKKLQAPHTHELPACDRGSLFLLNHHFFLAFIPPSYFILFFFQKCYFHGSFYFSLTLTPPPPPWLFDIFFSSSSCLCLLDWDYNFHLLFFWVCGYIILLRIIHTHTHIYTIYVILVVLKR